MRKKIFRRLLLSGMLFCSLTLFAQKAQKPLQLVQDAIRQGESFRPLRIQSSTGSVYTDRLRAQVSNYSLFTFDRANVFESSTNGPLELTLPAEGGNIVLQLVPVNILADGFSAKTSRGQKIVSTGWFYQGIVKGDGHSVAAISIFDNEIAGFISSSRGNYVVGRLRNTGDAINIVYRESTLLKRPSLNCTTPDVALPVPAQNQTALTNRCVRLYYETEYDFYLAFGSNATSVTNYVTNLFNQNKTLFNNDGVSVALSEIYVWTEEDPYDPKETNDIFTTLADFQGFRTSFNGDLGSLLTTRGIGGGLAAVIYGLCGPVANRLCVSGNLTTSFPNVPTYSWEVMVTTHELGHLMGSRHTHACVWNGNNTAIDGCAGFTEGGCSVPGIPSGGGTIMSYCHLQSVGINFSNGFGAQPGAQIRNSVEASTCLGSCMGDPEPCSIALTGLNVYNVGDTSATVSWNAYGMSLNGYTLEYKAASSSTWITVGTFVFNIMQIYGLTPNTLYDWRVKANCKNGSSPYAYGQFTTLETGMACGTPTGLVSSPDCFFSDVSWNPVPDAINYTLEYKKTSAISWTVTTTSSNYGTVTGTAGLYNWRVKANCAAGSGNYATSTTSILSPHAPQCEIYVKNGGKNAEAASPLKMQPQPASNQVTVLYNAAAQAKGIISIHNQTGTVMLRKAVQLVKGDNRTQLDITALRAGVYMIRLETGGQAVSEKLIVDKR